ncbi:MAG: glycosyltransferase family 39 protein [Chloroflexi bacterium]|nr:MAG: glycosyltransferase family 39 protein [Chloroflexota bacterium]
MSARASVGLAGLHSSLRRRPRAAALGHRFRVAGPVSARRAGVCSPGARGRARPARRAHLRQPAALQVPAASRIRGRLRRRQAQRLDALRAGLRRPVSRRPEPAVSDRPSDERGLRRADGDRVGLIAALLTAITYLLARDAHFGVNDALVTLLATLGLVFCVRVAQGGSRGDYFMAGTLAGLAFAAKYHGIALLAPLVLAHVSRSAPRRARDLALAVGACLAAAVVGFPSLVTESGRVLQDIYLHLYLAAVGGYDGLDPAGGYVFYARTLVTGLGWLLLAASVAGVVLSIRRRDWSSIVVVSLPAVLLAVLGAQQLYFARFLLPALPALLVEAALALETLAGVRPAAGLAAALLVGAPSLVDTLRFDVLLSREDTRTLARSWIESNLPPLAIVAVDSAPLGPSLSSQSSRQVLVANEWSLFDLTADDYRARGVEYVVASSFTSEVRAVDPTREARRQAFYAALPREASVTAQFRPYPGDQPPPFVYDQIYAPFNALDQLERPGPTITVYRLNARPGTPP